MLLQTERQSNGTGLLYGHSLQHQQQHHHHHHHHQPRLMDSPTLARVERALLRHGEGENREGQDIIRARYTQSLWPNTNSANQSSTQLIKKGLLWQQRDKLFSRWKERYFILTRDYLHCFRRASGADRISEMGQFLFKVKLVDVDRVEWENKKTYSTVALVIGRDGKIYLRASDGLEDWFELLEECMLTSKERRKALRYSHDATGRLLNENVCTPKQEVTLRRKEWSRDTDWDQSTLDNRLSRKMKVARSSGYRKKRKWYQFGSKLSILTDIDINSYEDSTLGAPSVTSYRMSRDVFCVQPQSLRGAGSFRSSRDSSQPPKRAAANIPDTQCQYIKFRERSYSDIQHIERKPWREMSLADHQ
ncbi:uncharacterized protein LOC143202479 isoform X2 [Rhynchophorus ferrugineus]|uniref:uncharacterized protein LOC143202479 isoform X2 n=1 Tax=Rhynchophorus ferrugineus TaxID=354439 RepID=UPI003FCC7B52